MYLGVAPSKPVRHFATRPPTVKTTTAAPQVKQSRTVISPFIRALPVATQVIKPVLNATVKKLFSGGTPQIITAQKQLTVPVWKARQKTVTRIKTVIPSVNVKAPFRFMRGKRPMTNSTDKLQVPVDKATFANPDVNAPLPITVVPPVTAATTYTGSDAPAPSANMADVAANMANTVALSQGAAIPTSSDPATSGTSAPGASGWSLGTIVALAAAGYFLWKGIK